MASGIYNNGSTKLQDRTVDYISDTIKVMLVTSSYSFNKDETSLTAAAAAELTVSGYTGGYGGAGRKTLGTKTITNDATNDRTVYDAADPSAWTLASGETVGGAIVCKEITNDAGSIPLFFVDFTDTPTNGGTFTLQFSADGIAYTQQ